MDIKQKTSQEILDINKAEWDKIKIRNLHADINLIKCQKRLFGNGQGKKLLYIGFGEGQNLIYFLEEGFECYGTEISQTRLDFVKDKLAKNKQSAYLKLVGSNILPFADDFFDVVIAWQSNCYNNEQGFKESLEEVLRVLKSGGHFLSSVPSTEHTLCGQEVAPSVYRPINTADQTDCVMFAFKNKEQIKEVYNKFKNLQIGYHTSDLFGTKDFYYVMACQK